MIQKVTNYKQLKQFIYFKAFLYEDDPHFVPPLYFILKRELKTEVLKKKRYTALLDIDNNQINGRILYTIDDSKQHHQSVGYFSFYDVIDDLSVSKRLFEAMIDDLKTQGIKIVEGTFTPYDPDTRRGILIKGFDDDPVIFSSYNKPYYQTHLEQLGFTKMMDTVALKADVSDKTYKRLNAINRFFNRNHDVRIDALSFKHLDRDMKDVHTILNAADHDIIYQETPNMSMIEHAARQLKPFINPKMILIARENKTNTPIAFSLVLPDYHQVFKAMKGRFRPWTFFRKRKQITRARGMMQYVIPRYQNSGLLGAMFYQMYVVFKEEGIRDFEAGTIVESNVKSIEAFNKFGGDITKIYRIYRKDI
jgi:hypothetical protein